MSKEVSEKDALLDCVRTQRPFMMVQLWKTAEEIEDGRLVIVKTPVVSKLASMLSIFRTIRGHPTRPLSAQVAAVN